MSNETEKEAVLAVISKRKSVRSFVIGKIVSKEDLTTLAKAGMAAPSGKNAQPWEFVVINEPDAVKEMAQAMPYAEMLIDAGAAIVICGNTSRINENNEALWTHDLCAAAQNILLAAEAMGLGACWCQVYPYEERMNGVKAALALPPQIVPFNIICLGYPTGYDQPQDKWNPRRLQWNKWSSQI